eukprot:CAMPEP_0119113826 /NCGR_PEP_ID=MMETSP1180-20130426/45309_1 /TAXON_ID=3052 ORGANISM="Chlamydomonas cf sp, Strain CCMP681" /NCGR_SAMPLE_ID=MMETSP1180 /ASSEMBLY_ACC=CAM_ASM_000741 /LENGTH=186 /DNA_ID=CAMNT_0007102081 /DNA_START=201 /DNA_END=761 /DNA_ORIENTATION=-
MSPFRSSQPETFPGQGHSLPSAPSLRSTNGAGGPLTSSSSSSTAARAQDALQHLASASRAVDQGQFTTALAELDALLAQEGDLALASYARTARALLLYQLGDAQDALLALEDQEVAQLGTAEIHAALAVLMWNEKPALAFRAEQEWEAARGFDTRYSNPEWVSSAKHWPPRMLDALQRFLTLDRQR